MVIRRIYWFTLALSLLVGVYFYGLGPGRFESGFLLYFAVVPFFLFTGSVHGLIAHTISPTTKTGMMIYPLIMGVLYASLFFIHLFILVPLLCPGILPG